MPRARDILTTSSKCNALVEELRRRIVEGRYGPDTQIPTRADLEKEFDASPTTVQRAADLLIRQGFLYAKGRRATFVSPYPPHRNQYALVFESHPSPTTDFWSRYMAVLRDEAESIERRAEPRGATRFSLYFDITGHTDVDDYHRLLADARGHRLAGAILIQSVSSYLANSEIVQGNLPCVAIAVGEPPPKSKLMMVSPEYGRYMARALDYARARGRRRPALIGGSGWSEFQDECAKRAMTTRPFWLQSPQVHNPDAIRNAAHLLMRTAASDRPDCLIIGDDHLVEHATAGLVGAGARVPEDLLVVAFNNFPWIPPASVPVTRLGFDIRQLLSTATRLIDRRNAGQKTPAKTLIGPVFEDEIVRT